MNLVTGTTRERRALEYVRHHATQGDPDSVLKALDTFGWEHQFLMNVGDRKGLILDEIVEKYKPVTIVELGAYCGYSAVRLSRKLPLAGQLYSIEISDDHAAVAREVVEFAGLSNKVSFIIGSSENMLRKLHATVKSVDMFFFDHAKGRYLPDLKLIEELRLLHPGSVIAADNVLFPGTPGILCALPCDTRRLSPIREGSCCILVHVSRGLHRVFGQHSGWYRNLRVPWGDQS